MQRAAVAERLQTVGGILVLIGLLWRLGLALYAVASVPSLGLLSWDGLAALLNGVFRGRGLEDMPLAVRLPAAAMPLGAVLWLVGWLLQPRRNLSKE